MLIDLNERNTMDALHIALCAVWATGVILHIVKHVMPAARSSMTYGKHEAYLPDGSRHGVASVPLRLAWSASYLIGLLCALSLPRLLGLEPSLVLVLFGVQVTRRLYECLFIHRFSTTRHMPVVQAAVIAAYYIGAALTIVVHAASHAPTYETKFTVAALILFVPASVAQHIAHRQLATVTPLVGKYGIPSSPLFYLVWCPHYTAEVAIYTAFFLLMRSRTSFSLFLFDVSIMTSTAADAVNWYIRTFPPSVLPTRKRYAIFPFVF